MPLSFPSSPTTGQQSTQNGRVYAWSGSAWEFAATGGGEDTGLRSFFVPPAPTSVAASAGNAQAVVSWTAPSVLAQTPITDYSVQYSSNSGSTWTTFTDAVSTALSATVTGLANSVAVIFRVAAVNGIGTGAFSAASASVTPAVPVTDPYFSSVALLLHADGNLNDSSSLNRTSSITTTGTVSTAGTAKFGSASMQFSGAGKVVVPSDASLTFAGDFTIEFWVQFTSKPSTYICFLGGSSGSASPSQIFLTTKVTGDGLRWGLSDVAEYASGDFTWATGTSYYVAVKRTSGAVTLWVNGNNITTGTPTNTTTYAGGMHLFGGVANVTDFSGLVDEFRITKGVARTITLPTAAFPNSGPMSVPTSLAATGGNAQISLTWAAPAYNGGSAITGYSVEYTPSGGSAQTVSTGSTATSYTLTGLTNGTPSYTFRVAGINSNGTGAFSAASAAVTAGVVTLFAPGANTANYNYAGGWDSINWGNVTTVGTNGGPSRYGTYDQSGNVYEWNDLDGTPGNRAKRGGYFGNSDPSYLAASFSALDDPSWGESLICGFRLASSFSTLNPLSLSSFVTIGDINNNADTGGTVGKGSVSYSYAIGKYIVTNTEYREFLTAVAATDTYDLYRINMAGDRGGITRSGTSGSYTYAVKTNYGNKPVNYVSWWDCARYCNWLHNGKPTGIQDNSTTEAGAYTLSGATTGNAVAKNAGAKYHIPLTDEWYKAAFYKGGGTSAGYWLYATQSDTAPAPISAADSDGNGPYTPT